MLDAVKRHIGDIAIGFVDLKSKKKPTTIILLKIIWAFKVNFIHQYGLITLTPMVEVV